MGRRASAVSPMGGEGCETRGEENRWFSLILQWELILSFFCVCVSQWAMATECFQLGYNAEGHCKGEADSSIPEPQKLNWDIPPEVSQTIDEWLQNWE